NDFLSEELWFSLHPEATDFQTNIQLGPRLAIHYLPKQMAPCFAKESKSQLLIWDASTSECYTLEEKDIEVQITKEQKRYFIAYQSNGHLNAFLPDHSPWPLTKELKPDVESPLRVFDKNK